jgi:hypothetical protein
MGPHLFAAPYIPHLFAAPYMKACDYYYFAAAQFVHFVVSIMGRSRTGTRTICYLHSNTLVCAAE